MGMSEGGPLPQDLALIGERVDGKGSANVGLLGRNE